MTGPCPLAADLAENATDLGFFVVDAASVIFVQSTAEFCEFAIPELVI